MTRIGIYGGTFDPLHVGHISFALAAIAEAGLSQVYFLPERSPRYKPSASEYSTRVAALEQTLSGYHQLQLLEFPEQFLSVHDTLPELTRIFPDAKLVLLIGADVVTHMHTWPELNTLVATCDFVVGMRDTHTDAATISALHQLGITESRYHIVHTDQSHMSSTIIRSSETR